MVKLRVANRSFLHMEVEARDGRRWLLTTVYANPQPTKRRFLWKHLEALEVELPWELIGDFNCILKDEERSSNVGASTAF